MLNGEKIEKSRFKKQIKQAQVKRLKENREINENSQKHILKIKQHFKEY